MKWALGRDGCRCRQRGEPVCRITVPAVWHKGVKVAEALHGGLVVAELDGRVGDALGSCRRRWLGIA